MIALCESQDPEESASVIFICLEPKMCSGLQFKNKGSEEKRAEFAAHSLNGSQWEKRAVSV